MFGYLLLSLAPVAALAYVIWSYRKRAMARAAASTKRFTEMFGPIATPVAGTPLPVGAHPAPPVPAAVREAMPAPLCTARDALLDAKHAELLHALSARLPECRIFPHVSLAAIVQLPPAVQGREREQRLRAIAQNSVDCIVCDHDAHVMAAIDCEDGAASAEYRIKSDYLAAAGVRYLRLDPAALPASEALRNGVVGRPFEHSA